MLAMESSLPKSLKQLWELAASLSSKYPGSGPESTFDPVGLILELPLKNGGYWCTPINSLAFAWTGGDGEHYSLITTNNVISEDSPVVMTVPMNDQEKTNIIVGENLVEFLALGCRSSYVVLPQFSYDFESTLNEFKPDQYDDEMTKDEIELLKAISDTFHLVPWYDFRTRLQELRSKYYHLLELPSEPEIQS